MTLLSGLALIGAIAAASVVSVAADVPALDPREGVVLPVDPTVLEKSLQVESVWDPDSTVLNQCSRKTPLDRLIVQRPRVTSPPTQAEIAAIEAALGTLLADRLGALREAYGVTTPADLRPVDFRRQYSAFNLGPWRLIYVNGFYVYDRDPLIRSVDWQSTPMIICDGGENAFGVEYYPAIKRFANFSFNGTYSGPLYLKR